VRAKQAKPNAKKPPPAMKSLGSHHLVSANLSQKKISEERKQKKRPRKRKLKIAIVLVRITMEIKLFLVREKG